MTKNLEMTIMKSQDNYKCKSDIFLLYSIFFFFYFSVYQFISFSFFLTLLRITKV